MTTATMQLIDVALRAGTKLGRTPDGTLVHLGAPPELVAELDVHATRVKAATYAPINYLKESGKRERRRFVWRRCHLCGQEILSSTDGACRVTPGCKGRALVYTDPPPLELDGSAVPCARPGCERPACHLTHTHEPLCGSDFVHLALYHEHHRKAPHQ